MEAARFEGNFRAENESGASHFLANSDVPSSRAENLGGSEENKAFSAAAPPDTHTQLKDSTPSVFQCYVFKSRLQEYCQKAGVTSPVYETIKQGPSHEPIFRSSVTVGDATFDSLPGFFNRKAAEQSAAEVALMELAKSGDLLEKSQPVQESGLCKNLLQEYAQKMNYAAPLYECHRDEKPSNRTPMHYCIVEIGGIKYIGASAKTKKQAEIKAARTALVAIQSASSPDSANSAYTVVPLKRSVSSDLGINSKEAMAPPALKPKRKQFKKFRCKRRGNKESYSEQSAAAFPTVDIGMDATMLQSYNNNNNNAAKMDDAHSCAGDLQDKINGVILHQEVKYGSNYEHVKIGC